MIDKEMLLKKRIELNHLDDYNNVKHIVFGVDSNYIKYAAVTMLSIVNYNQTTKIVFHGTVNSFAQISSDILAEV